MEGPGLNVGKFEPQSLQCLIDTVQDGLGRRKGDYAYGHSAEISRNGVGLAPVKAREIREKSSETVPRSATGEFFGRPWQRGNFKCRVNFKSCMCPNKLDYSHECNCRP